MKEVLQAIGIDKYFLEPENFHVLNNISLSIFPGQFISLVGKSGCGKSSLLYILSTLDTDFTGSLEIAGQKVNGLKENELSAFRNQHIGFIFQYHYLLPEFTVLQNVMIPALKLGVLNRAAIKMYAVELLTTMEVDSQSNKLAGKLSSGQQQRVSIARALINRPSIIMADEPTGNLDSHNTSIIFNIFRNLADQGNSIISVTHDLDFASGSDRIFEMQDGKIKNERYE